MGGSFDLDGGAPYGGKKRTDEEVPVVEKCLSDEEVYEMAVTRLMKMNEELEARMLKNKQEREQEKSDLLIKD